MDSAVWRQARQVGSVRACHRHPRRVGLMQGAQVWEEAGRASVGKGRVKPRARSKRCQAL